MIKKIYFPLFSYLITLSVIVNGQQVNISEEYLSFEASGLDGSEIKMTLDGEIVNVLSIGGFTKIHKTSTYIASENKIYLKRYYNQEHSFDIDLKDQENILPSNTEVYLLPDSELFIDVLDRQSDKLLRRYVLRRPKIIPQIKFFNNPKDIDNPFYLFNGDSQTDKLDLQSELQFYVASIQRNDFKNLEIEYTLLNLKNHKSLRGTIQSGMTSFNLDGDSTYELKFNYSMQKESVGTVIITVKPNWYSSILVYVIAFIALLTFVLFLFNKQLKNNLIKSKKEQSKLEEAAIKLQSLLNPHFTFNALSSIQGLMNGGNIDEANQYLHEFSSLLRKSLSKSKHVFHSLDQELEMMKIYIRLEALRFNFNWEITVDDALNISEIEVPTMLLQPLIENAVKHGLSNLSEYNELVITCGFGTEKNSFEIVVKDNGHGLNPNAELGYGLSLTQKRIEAINQLNNHGKITLDFDIQSGTKATLTFNNWLSI